MKSILIKCSIVVLTFIAGSSIYLFTASKHANFWKKNRQARVFFNGQPSNGSIVYRRPDGFMVLNTAEDGAWYVLGEGGEVEYCKSFAERSHRFFSLPLPGYLYVWHYGDYPCVAGIMVFDVVPPKVVTDESIEFSSRTKVRIRVDW